MIAIVPLPANALQLDDPVRQIASLPMYARPELAAEHILLWGAIWANFAAKGISAPQILTQIEFCKDSFELGQMFFTQTCGMPFRLGLANMVTLIGTPDYGLDSCPPGFYNSALIVHESDARTTLSDFTEATLAFNSKTSQSGFAAPQSEAASLGFQFKHLFQSTSHSNSAKIVAERGADIAAIDAVTWRFLQTYEPAAKELRVLGMTAPTPGLPYVGAKNLDKTTAFHVVKHAIDTLPPSAKGKLGLKGLVDIPASQYFAVQNP